MTTTLADEVVTAFRRDGAVVLRGVLTPAEVALARAGIDEVLARPGALALRASRDGDGAFVEDFCRWSDVAAIESVARCSALPAVASRLMGSATVRLYHDHVLVKEPGTGQRTPWHQDQPYYNVDGHQTVSFWLPVDAVPRASSLELLAGSHRGPWLMPRTFLAGEAKWFPEGSLVELPDIEADRDAFPILGWSLQPGDAVAFDMLTVHGAGGHQGPGRRRVLSLRYTGDDVVHRPRPWPTSPPFPGLEDELPDGAALDNPRFPLVWPA